MATEFGRQRLHDVDMVTGALSNPRKISPVLSGSLAGISTTPDGTTYVSIATVSHDPNDSLIFEVDVNTGVSSPIGPSNIGPIFVEGDIEFDPVLGRMYGFHDFASQLFEFDLTTGAAIAFGSFSTLSDPSAMAFDATGRLFVFTDGIFGHSDTLCQIDPATGADIACLDTDPQIRAGVAGMAFDPDNPERLFMVTGVPRSVDSTPSFYRIDVDTGVATLISVHPSIPLSGLEFIPITPPP